MSCSVPVRASCPQPQNSATPKKHKPVATSEAKGAPMRHLAQHSSKPKEKRGEVGRGRWDRESPEPAAQGRASVGEGTCPAGGGKQVEGKPRNSSLRCCRAKPSSFPEICLSSRADLHPSIPRDKGSQQHGALGPQGSPWG